MKKGLSIIVCAYDRPALLRKTLESLRSLEIPAGTEAEILAVISPNQDATWAAADGAPAGNGIPIRRFQTDQLGLSIARNRGLAEARFEHVAYFDDDVDVARDWIDGFFEAVEQHRADCVVGPVSPIYDLPAPAFLSQNVLRTILSPYSRRGDRILTLAPDVAHEVPGCNFGVRKDVALAVGGFDPRFGRAGPTNTGGDDFEFGLRLVAAGKRVVYHPQCAIGHRITAEKLDPTWFRTRWYGNGVAQRVNDEDKGMPFTLSRKARLAFGVARKALTAAAYRLVGRPSAAFEKELRMREALGYLKGPKR